MTSLSGSLPFTPSFADFHHRTAITIGLENCAVPLRVINEHSALLGSVYLAAMYSEGICLFTVAY
jgi:hypothetical protein